MTKTAAAATRTPLSKRTPNQPLRAEAEKGRPAISSVNIPPALLVSLLRRENPPETSPAGRYASEKPTTPPVKPGKTPSYGPRLCLNPALFAGISGNSVLAASTLPAIRTSENQYRLGANKP